MAGTLGCSGSRLVNSEVIASLSDSNASRCTLSDFNNERMFETCSVSDDDMVERFYILLMTTSIKRANEQTERDCQGKYPRNEERRREI